MPCCKSPPALDHVPGRRRGLWFAVVLPCAMAAAGMGLSMEVQAQQETSSVTLTRHQDGLYLTARIPLELTPAMEEVLSKGVPLHFQWSADLVQSRWYWVDRTVTSQARSVRLTYHPLTRRWRLSQGSGALQYTLHQNFDTLREALLVASRVSDWKIAEAAQLGNDANLKVDFRFAIDQSQLPRPFQLGLNSQSGLSLSQHKTLPVPDRVTPEADIESAEPRPEGPR